MRALRCILALITIITGLSGCVPYYVDKSWYFDRFYGKTPTLLPGPVYTGPLLPQLAVTEVVCSFIQRNSSQNLTVTATIDDRGTVDATAFYVAMDVTYTEANQSAPNTKHGLALTAASDTNPSRPMGTLPAGQTTEVQIPFFSGRLNPAGSQPNIDPADGPFQVTVTANSGNATGAGVVQGFWPVNNVRNCMCDVTMSNRCN